jgi:hypothetical protein
MYFLAGLASLVYCVRVRPEPNQVRYNSGALL